MTMVPINNLSKGELAPELQARIDTSQYSAGTRRMRNFIVQRYGGASFRPGFRFVGEVDSPTTEIKYIPFQYNIEQAYIMALDNGYMRLLAQGGFVVEAVTTAAPTESMKITAITKAVNAQVTAAFHAYSVGDRVYLSGITGMTELNGRFASVVSVVDANNFTINIDTRLYTTFVSSTGLVRAGAPAAVVPPAAPAVPPAPPADPPTTDGGGSGADLGEYDFGYGTWSYQN